MSIDCDKRNMQFECTSLQSGMLFQDLIAPDDHRNHEQLLLSFTEVLDDKLVYKAIQEITARHDALRTTLIWNNNDQATCIVNPHSDVFVSTVNIYEHEVYGYVKSQRDIRFELDTSPPIKWCHIKCKNSGSKILITLHHILMDGASYLILLSEFLSLYLEHPLPAATNAGMCQYSKWLTQKPDNYADIFWRSYLENIEKGYVFGGTVSGLDYSSTPVELSMKLTSSQSQLLNNKINNKGYSLATVFAAAWAMTLHSYVQHDGQVQFGITRYGRTSLPFDCASEIGLFINTTPLAVDLKDLNDVDAILDTTYKALKALRQWEHTPLIDIEKCSPLKDQGIFDSILVFDRAPLYDQLSDYHENCGLTDVENLGMTHYPVTVVGKGGNNIHIGIEADSNVVDENTLEFCLTELINWIYTLLELDPLENQIFEYKEN